MHIDITAQFLYGFILGISLGSVICYMTRKTSFNIDIERFIHIVMVMSRLVMHLYSFFNGNEIPGFFDFVGGASFGRLIGLDVLELLSKIKLGKK